LADGGRILATSGGFRATERWGVLRAGSMLREALRRTGSPHPRVTLLMTALGDDAVWAIRCANALAECGAIVRTLALFPQPSTDPGPLLRTSDLVWVGGGSVANLLAVWRLHGVAEAMAEAWRSGTILAGVSAGSICWHVGGPTDSFGPVLQPLDNGLGLLPYGNGVHYDSEPQRRPLLNSLVADGILPTSFATDDRIGIWYEGVRPTEVLTDLDPAELTALGDPARWPAAYCVTRTDTGHGSVETRLPIGPIPVSLVPPSRPA